MVAILMRNKIQNDLFISLRLKEKMRFTYDFKVQGSNTGIFIFMCKRKKTPQQNIKLFIKFTYPSSYPS